jgi:hypothetical protein
MYEACLGVGTTRRKSTATPIPTWHGPYHEARDHGLNLEDLAPRSLSMVLERVRWHVQ